MEPLFRRLFVDLPRADERIKICTVRLRLLRRGFAQLHRVSAPGVKATQDSPALVSNLQIDESKLSDEQRRGLPAPSSKPLFVVYKVRI